MPDVSFITSSTALTSIPLQTKPSVTIVVQGRQEISCRSKQVIINPGQCVVTSGGAPAANHITEASQAEPFIALTIRLNQPIIADLLPEVSEVTWKMPSIAGPAVSTVDPELLDTVFRTLRLLDRPEEQFVLGPLAERELLWRLLLSDQGALVRRVGVVHNELARIQRAVRWINSHYGQTIRSEALARIACMSVSSLNRHFRAATGMSPIEYQRQVRLQQARSRLIQEDSDVASIGAEVGYESPSQFGREYRRIFGISPGRDARRMRAALLRSDQSIIPHPRLGEDAAQYLRCGSNCARCNVNR